MAVDDGTDRVLAIYSAIRAHELELNRATAAFEHMVVAPLTLLNGGAAAAWLSFIATSDDPPSVAPAAPWVVGLVLAVAAAHLGWRGQRNYAQAERHRREALELLWLSAEREPADPAAVAAIATTRGLKSYSTSGAQATAPWFETRKDSTSSAKRARRFQLAFISAVWLSTVAFLVGSAVASASV